MVTQTGGMIRKSVENPDVRRETGLMRLDFIRLFDRTLAQMTLKPGWKWSRDARPLAKSDSCFVGHLMYVIGGRLNVRMDDGNEFELRAGDCAEIAPGHDAWVVGNEEFRAIDFNGDELLQVTEGIPGSKPGSGPEDRYVEGY